MRDGLGQVDLPSDSEFAGQADPRRAQRLVAKDLTFQFAQLWRWLQAKFVVEVATKGVVDVAWEALSSAEMISANYDQTLLCQQRAFELADQAGDVTHQARERAAHALALGYLGELDAAHAELEAATELIGATGNPSMLGFCSYEAGELRLDVDPATALPLLERARDIGRLLGNRYLVAIAGVSAVSCATRIEHPAHTPADYGELLDYFDRTGSRAQQWTTIRTLIETLTRRGADEPAATLYGALTASSSTPPLVGPDAKRMEQAVGTLRTRLGEQRHEGLLATGVALGDRSRAPVGIVTWGAAEQCATRTVLAAIGGLLPPPPSRAGGPFALSEPGKIEDLAAAAGLTPTAAADVAVAFEFVDLDTAVRGHLSSGPGRRAIEVAGREAVGTALRAALESSLRPDGSSHQANVLRYLVAHAP